MTKINMLKGKMKPVVRSRRRLILWIGVPMVLAVWGYAGYRVYQRSSPQTPSFRPSVEFTLTGPNSASSLGESSSSKPPEDEFREQNEAAQDLYDLINVLWFEGKLPNAIVRYKHLAGAFGAIVTATIKTKTPVIYIDPDLNPNKPQLGMTLSHEACHESVGETEEPVRGTSHGKAFEACMFRLARIGALVPYW